MFSTTTYVPTPYLLAVGVAPGYEATSTNIRQSEWLCTKEDEILRLREHTTRCHLKITRSKGTSHRNESMKSTQISVFVLNYDSSRPNTNGMSPIRYNVLLVRYNVPSSKETHHARAL